MKLRNVSIWFSVTVFLMLGVNTLIMWRVMQAYDDVLVAQEHRNNSVTLTNELYNETEQLARLVRSYTITGDSRYLFFYYDILGIRQGQKPAPETYNPIIYWDDAIAGRIQHALPKDGVKRSIDDRMKYLGFAEQEFRALTRVLAATDAMNKIEQIAFASTQGLYDPDKNDFVSDGKPRLDFASQLVHSKNYNLLKADLAHAVNDMRSLTDERTQAEVTKASAWLRQLILLSLASMVITLILVAIAFQVVKKRVLRPIQHLKVSADGVSGGDYAIRTHLGHANGEQSVDELMVLGNAFDSMAQAIQDDIGRRHAAQKEIEAALGEVEQANHQIMESISYAKVIQAAVMPSADLVQALLGQHFIIWEPKAVVGGDIYAMERVKNGFMLAVIDCTGHGVPGAFMTMVVMSSIKQIISEGSCQGPAEMLKRLNGLIKLSLYHHGKGKSEMDDGLEIGVCWFDFSRGEMIFSASRFPLLIAQAGSIRVLEGDKHRLGYRDVNVDYEFSEQVIRLEPGQRFYMYSDGFVDQVGITGFPLGKRKLRELIQQNCHHDLNVQGEIYQEALARHQGEQKRRDDVTMLGWEISAY